MIGCIKGDIISLSAPSICLLTSSGIGYDIELPVPDFCQLQLNNVVQIWTHLVIREDAQLLYGFIEEQQRDIFRQLIKINGVGAKMALAMLSNLTINELKQCVADKNENILVRIPGIGKKTAQRLLIELEDKLKNITLDSAIFDNTESFSSTSSTNSLTIAFETKSALMSLGYKDKEADKVIKLIQESNDRENSDIKDTQSLLKLALKYLSKH